MKIVLASIVRNGAGYLPRYFAQAEQLRRVLDAYGHELWHAIAEGDSSDSSLRLIKEWISTRPGLLIKADHGGPQYGSVNVAERWRNIARTWNTLFDAIRWWDADALIYCEADLIWDAPTLWRLVQHLERVPAAAPMVYLGSSGVFYDTWGYRASGSNFQNAAPYHAALVGNSGELVQLDSAGSCKALRFEIVQNCRFDESDAMIGHDLYRNGYSLWLDPTLKVTHP